MGAFDPSKFQLIDCELVHARYETHPYLRDNTAIERIDEQITYDVWPYFKLNKLFLWLKVELTALMPEAQPLARGTYYFRALFDFDNFDELFAKKEDEKVFDLDTDAIIASVSITLSTVRGQLQIMLAKTAFTGYSLRIQTVQ